MNKLLKQLKSLKHDPRFGGMDQVALDQSWSRIAEAIGTHEVAQPTLVASPSYATWLLSQYISKPVMAGAFSVAVIATGWMTTVRAADSLPGQTLYSVKMITERAQLKLASNDRRAVLHTEFAGRRLQEASDLREASDTPESASLVRGAIEAYKQEVASAGENLRQLKDEDGATAIATAASVQQNLQVINTAIDQAVSDSGTAEAAEEVLAVREVTQEVSDVATTVVVDAHEQEQTELSEKELKQMFRADLGQIEARQRFDLERIEVIRAALSDPSISYEGLTVPTDDELLAYEYPITAIDSLLSQAMNSFAAGGFRTAFETLQEIDRSLLDIEADLAQIEIMIMNARAQTAAQAPVVEESEGVEEGEVTLE